MDLPTRSTTQPPAMQDHNWVRADKIAMWSVASTLLSVVLLDILKQIKSVAESAMTAAPWVYTLLGVALMIWSWKMARDADKEVRLAYTKLQLADQWAKDVQVRVDSEEAKLQALIAEEKRVLAQQEKIIAALNKACDAKEETCNAKNETYQAIKAHAEKVGADCIRAESELARVKSELMQLKRSA